MKARILLSNVINDKRGRHLKEKKKDRAISVVLLAHSVSKELATAAS